MTRPGRVWLVLPDLLSVRVFVESGLLAALGERLGDDLVSVPVPVEEARELWGDRLRVDVDARTLAPFDVPLPEKVSRRVDDTLERHLGFFPLAVRFNYRHGFHLERMEPGHPNRFLDTSLIGPLPRRPAVDRTMERWYFSPHRYVPAALRRALAADCRLLVLSNIQISAAGRFLTAGRRLGLPTVGYVASWDHPVGKGVMSPHLDRYIVQNELMRRDLARYHAIVGDRVVVTGWPQSDAFHRRRPREDFDALLRRHGLDADADRPVVLITGNSPTNAPYEGRFVERLVGWWQASARDRITLLFRPHPRDTLWQERYAAALAAPGVGVQAPSYTDLDDLATILQHVAVVVTNAGTILLDALANDRPAVCVTYDEGAPPGESWAAKNVLGEHYRELMSSGAFLLADTFEAVVGGVEDGLADPGQRRQDRARVTREVLGDVDGGAVERVVDALLEPLP